MRVLFLALLLLSLPRALNIAAPSNVAVPVSNQVTQYIYEYNLNRTDAAPGPIAVTPNGTIWFVEANASRLAKFDRTNGVTEFNFTNTSDYTPTWLAVLGTQALTSDSKGNLWFSFISANKIGYFNTTSRLFQYYNLNLMTHRLGNFAPYGIAVDPDGIVWFAESGASAIGRLDPAKNSLTEYNLTRPNGPHVNPYQVTFDINGSLWITSIWYLNQQGNPTSGSTLTRLNIATGQTDSFDLSGTGILTPVGLAVDQWGHAWIGDHGGSWLGEFDIATGKAKLHWGSLPPLVPNHSTLTDRGGLDISLISYNVVLGKDGTPWFMEHFAGRVGHYIPSNDSMVEYNIPTPNSITPFIAADKAGGIWFTEWAGNKLGYLDSQHAKPPFTVSPHALAKSLVKGFSTDLTLNVTNTSPHPINITYGIDSTDYFGSPLANATIASGSTQSMSITMNSSSTFLQPGNYSEGRFAYAVPVITVADGKVNYAIPVTVLVVAAELGLPSWFYPTVAGILILTIGSASTLLYWQTKSRKESSQN